MIPITMYNTQIFKETCRIVKLGCYVDFNDVIIDIKDKIQYSISETKTISKDCSFENELAEQLNLRNRFGDKEKGLIFSRIEVTNESTTAAARRFLENRTPHENIPRVCALNFANGFEPGGGVLKGCTAQEETICRQSNLYSCIVNQREMYEYNISQRDPSCSDYMIYSPDVMFFRDDEYELRYPVPVSVITSPAPDLRNVQINQQILIQAHKIILNRCRKILQLAMYTKNKILILGAFGCGAFLNSPEDVSQIFKELLVDEFYGMYFDKIVFAIYGKSEQSLHNLSAFNEAFHK